MLKTSKFIFILISTLFLTSCGPTALVTINVSNLFPENIGKVTVNTDSTHLPKHKSYVGDIEVTDPSGEEGYTYQEVVSRAVSYAKRMGGTDLYIYQHSPASLLNCSDQIWAEVYRSIPAKKKDSTILQPQKTLTRNSISSALSYAQIWYGKTSKRESGIYWSTGLTYIKPNGYGYGFKCSSFQSHQSSHFQIQSFQLELMKKRNLSHSWITQASVGCGYSRLLQKFAYETLKQNALGFNTNWGIHYYPSTHVSIGAQFDLDIHSYPEETNSSEDNEAISHFILGLGINVSFHI